MRAESGGPVSAKHEGGSHLERAALTSGENTPVFKCIPAETGYPSLSDEGGTILTILDENNDHGKRATATARM